MKCADHPKRDAVASLKGKLENIEYQFGVCNECFRGWKKTMRDINWEKLK